jgi:hypothetical protein
MGDINHRSFWNPLRFTDHETMSMGWLLKRMDGEIDGFKLNLDPDYQRGHVWTDQQAANFMGHLLEGGAVPPIVINTDPNYVFIDEVVDGKQRITACYRWLKGEFPAELTDGRLVSFNDLDDDTQRYMQSMTGPRLDIGYVQLSRADVLRLYLRLNRGGTIHTDAEINNVRELLAAEDS